MAALFKGIRRDDLKKPRTNPLMGLALLFLATSAWTEFQVNAWTNHDQYDPEVAMDADGGFVVVWRSHLGDGRGGGIYGRRFDAGGAPLGSEFKVNETSPAYEPSVAMDAAGNFVVAWNGREEWYGVPADDNPGVFIRRYDSGGVALSGEVRVDTAGPTAEWQHYGPRFTSVAMNGTGAFVVVWRHWRGSDVHNGELLLDGRLFDSNGVPQADQFRISSQPHCDRMSAAMADNGDFAVVWVRSGDTAHPPDTRFVRARFYGSDGTPKGEAIQANIEEPGTLPFPAVAMDNAGACLISWEQGEEYLYRSSIRARRYDISGNPLGEPFFLTESLRPPAYAPFVSVAEDDRFVATWSVRTATGGDYFDVFMRRFDSMGDPVGNQFRINAYTPESQNDSRVAMTPSGDKVVAVWRSQDQDGSGLGVFAHIDPIDSDNDRLADHVEDIDEDGFVDENETDPHNPDTDGDGSWDATELEYGTDPTDPNDTPTVPAATLPWLLATTSLFALAGARIASFQGKT